LVIFELIKGSSVIHLADKNVPNALFFIDKYTQIPSIINPIILTINNIESLTQNDEFLKKYVNEKFGSNEKLIKYILADFFKFGFDGSGGNNSFDAGDCIDGRLTSAWNWCSKISQKPFYNFFKLSGFIGFDGKVEN
jgi:hypothetical protein